MNSFSRHLDEQKMKPAEFARLHGLSKSTIWRVYKGMFRPRPDTAERIEQATNGAVTLRELLFPVDNRTGEGDSA